MLSYLRIRNLALIDEVVVEPGAGLTTLTGETGAGKSILLGGLALLAGERASLGQIRQGATEAVIEGVFDITGAVALLEMLEQEGLDNEEGNLLIRRTVSASGSRAYVNDRLVTLGSLRRFGGRLVEIVGQHENQTLLRAAAQLDLLDDFGGLGPQRCKVAEAYAAAMELHTRLEALRCDLRERAQRVDTLRFQVSEIRSAGLSAEEETELSAERQRLRHAEELATASSEALELLYERDGSVVEQIGRARDCLAAIERLDPAAEPWTKELDEARFGVEELSRRLQPYRDTLRADPSRLGQIEDRLAAIDALRRKYGDSVEDILARADSAECELASLENRDQQIESASARSREALGTYDREAAALTSGRERVAGELQERITAELQELGMRGARFGVRLRPSAAESVSGLPPGASRSGYESVEFLLAANPGEPLQRLARVASGGELSRVLLALKLAEVQGGSGQTLVFDEVDAGVGGGRVAECLAERLVRLGGSHQVLVVTHLPQIAARAETHLRVNKEEQGGRTQVRVGCLEAEARVDELARMLGGLQATESVREHARDLLGERS